MTGLAVSTAFLLMLVWALWGETVSINLAGALALASAIVK